jgi:hypothetical protein
MDMVTLSLASGGYDYFSGCWNAARCGHYDITMALFGKINGPAIPALLRAAYTGGNRALIDFFIAQKSPPDWTCAAVGACHSGRIDLVEEIYDHYPGPPADLIQYASVKSLAVVKYLVEKKKVSIGDEYCIAAAAESNRPEIVHYLLDAFPHVMTEHTFLRACECGRLEIVARLLPDNRDHIRAGFEWTCVAPHVDIMKFLAEHLDVDWNGALADVCLSLSENSLAAIEYCALKGATNFSGVLAMVKKGRQTQWREDVTDLLTRYGSA